MSAMNPTVPAETAVPAAVSAREPSARPRRRRREKDPQAASERRSPQEQDAVDEASQDSFPASDPPAFS